MGVVLGLNAKAYENTGTAGTPTWTLRNNVRDVTINLEKASADITTRGGGGFRQVAATLKEGSIDFQMVYDTTDALFTAIETAYFADSQIDMAFADGDITVEGTKYFRAKFEVTNFTLNQQLEEAMTVDVTLQSGFSTEVTPAFVTVPAP